MDFNQLTAENFEELFAMLEGENIETYRIKAAKQAQLNIEAEQYLNLPPDKWPRLYFHWDTSIDGHKFSLDGIKQKEFLQSYPDGFSLAWVDLEAFDSKLCHHSRRDGVEELWSLGCASKLSNVIAYLSHGYPISPPLVNRLESNELILQGGHHRYAVAKAMKLSFIPIHFEPKNFEAVASIIPFITPNNADKTR